MLSKLARVIGILAGLLLLTLAGCTHSAGDLCLIQPGCSRNQVTYSLGMPACACGNKQVEVFRYNLLTPKEDGTEPQLEPYYVRIVDGAVESYGKWEDLPTDSPVKN